MWKTEWTQITRARHNWKLLTWCWNKKTHTSLLASTKTLPECELSQPPEFCYFNKSKVSSFEANNHVFLPILLTEMAVGNGENPVAYTGLIFLFAGFSLFCIAGHLYCIALTLTQLDFPMYLIRSMIKFCFAIKTWYS